MVLALGEYLIDQFPDSHRPGGAPFNFSFHLFKLGLKVRLISRVGTDDTGHILMKYAASHGLDTSGIQVDDIRETGQVKVTLDKQGVASYHILPNRAYDHIRYRELTEQNETIDLIYFGTLIQRSKAGFIALQQFLKKMKGKAKRLCDLNLRPGCYSRETVIESLHQTDILKLNENELDEIKAMLGINCSESALLLDLSNHFKIELIALTRGDSGSTIFTQNQASSLTRDEIPRIDSVIDTVGAGDAYAAVLAFGVLNHWTTKKMLIESSRLAAYICSVRGAVCEDDSIYSQIIRSEEGNQNE